MIFETESNLLCNAHSSQRQKITDYDQAKFYTTVKAYISSKITWKNETVVIIT